MNTYKTGLYSEFLARMFLRMHGFRIVGHRYITGRNTGRAEIDIIAKRRQLMIFVEVKNRSSVNAAWDAITPQQIARLRRSAEGYITRTAWNGDARFDVIIVRGVRIKWVRGAF